MCATNTDATRNQYANPHTDPHQYTCCHCYSDPDSDTYPNSDANSGSRATSYQYTDLDPNTITADIHAYAHRHPNAYQWLHQCIPYLTNHRPYRI